MANSEKHELAVNGPEIWGKGYSVLLTSFWGWNPETWGTVGWTGQRGLTRRTNLLKTLTDPFITVCYITGNKSYNDPALKGKVAGFYLVGHQTGDRDQFTHPVHHTRDVEKWRHSLRAHRAFCYLPENRFLVKDLDPKFLKRARSVAAMGEIVSDESLIRRLRDTPWIETECYQPEFGAEAANEEIFETKGMVPAGPAASSSYSVAGGTQSLPRQLYILRLHGDLDTYLGRPVGKAFIIKIGLSASPDLRRQSFQKAMPRGTFQWKVERTTTSVGLSPYPTHDIAVRGEDAMKRYLATNAEWLGGEFYLASREDIDGAWEEGCRASAEAVTRK